MAMLLVMRLVFCFGYHLQVYGFALLVSPFEEQGMSATIKLRCGRSGPKVKALKSAGFSHGDSSRLTESANPLKHMPNRHALSSKA